MTAVGRHPRSSDWISSRQDQAGFWRARTSPHHVGSVTAPPPDSNARLDALERAVDGLRQEIAELRATAPARTDASRPHGRRASSGLRTAARAWATSLGAGALPTDRAGLETLVGRYAAVGVGALVVLMGVGAFLTWAVANFTVRPSVRVVLGLVAAAAVAVLGERLRRRTGGRRFGEVLLALALAMVHVDAWAAGPYLQLVSAETALGVAAAASAALTALAWRARQQSLFVVGVGGALLAPFVSGAAEVHPLVRPVYGWLVLTAGLVALVHGSETRRAWPAAASVLAGGVTIYTLAQLGTAVSGTARYPAAMIGFGPRVIVPHVVVQHLAPMFALACAAGPLATLVWRARRGTASATDVLLVRLALATLTTATVGLWASAGPALHEQPALVGLSLVAALAAAAVFALPSAAVAPARAFGGQVPALVVAGLVLPLATLASALAALAHLGTPTAAGVAAVWSALSAALAAMAWRRAADGADAPHVGPAVTAAGIASLGVVLLWTREHDALRVALLGAHAAITALVFARVPGRQTNTDGRPLLALAPPLIALVGATGWVAVLLDRRPAFAYPPFLTWPSAAASVVVLGWIVCARVVWRAGNDLLPRTERAAVVAIAAGVAVLWGREELARAVGPDVATFLLVGYFATAGIVTLAVGRARRIAAARQSGLALALYAALKAIVEVSQLDAVALRVGSYLLVGGFLLGVGYWYRRRDEDVVRAMT